MKKFILSIALLAACTLTLSAARSTQDDGNNVSVTGTEVTRADNTVSVVFQLHVGDGVTDKKTSLVIRPVLVGIEGQSELPPIIVRGARANTTSEDRAMNAAGVNPEGRYVTVNGSIVDYYASVPWQDWMSGSQLVFNGMNAGKGRATEVNLGVVASGLLVDQNPMEFLSASDVLPANTVDEQVRQPSTPSRQVYSGNTIGDELAAHFSFVEPVAKYNEALNVSSEDVVFDYNMPLILGSGVAPKEDEVSRFVEMTRLGAVRIQFDRGSNTVDRSLGENNKMLVELISSIKVIEGTPDLRVSQVVVVGFSAPEGADEKETLAMERAENTLAFITANSKVDPAVINVYNGSVDWVTLRALIAESNMPDKYKVLEIIDNVPAWGSTQVKGRMDYLMELGGGEAFSYIRQTFFPRLRQTGAYVKVYYETVQ